MGASSYYKGLKELPERRSYNQKVFDNSKEKGPGSLRYRIHARHVHYKDGPYYKNIDVKLNFDNIKKVWKHTKASYHPTIPEYANGQFEFFNAYKGINHTIKIRPVCYHIKGILEGNKVTYTNAFGINIDLEVSPHWLGLRKIIIIKEKPAQLQDLYFDFELDIGTKKVRDKQNKEWDQKSALDFKSNILKIGDTDKESYFRNAKVWDSGKGVHSILQPINIQFYKKEGKIYLRKTITKDILEKAIYPLYTDHPTSYTAGAGDGEISKVAVGWNNAHDATDGSSASPTGTTMITGSEPNGIDFVWRAFVPVDTSGIADSDIITAAILYLYVPQWGALNTDPDGKDYVVVVQTSQNSTATLITEDFDQCGAITSPTEGSNQHTINDVDEQDWITLTLNATGRGWIDKEGVSKLGVREGHDAAREEPSGPVYEMFETTENAGGHDPYLDITTTPGVTPYPTARLKKDLISGYHCFMNAYILAKIEGFSPLKLPDGTIF